MTVWVARTTIRHEPSAGGYYRAQTRHPTGVRSIKIGRQFPLALSETSLAMALVTVKAGAQQVIGPIHVTACMGPLRPSSLRDGRDICPSLSNIAIGTFWDMCQWSRVEATSRSSHS
jgi:hypothetical protein